MYINELEKLGKRFNYMISTIVTVGMSQVVYRLLHEKLFFDVSQSRYENETYGWNANITDIFVKDTDLKVHVPKLLKYQKVHRPWVGVD